MKKGVIITNIGSPDDTSVFSVMKYLRQFLGDPRVLDFRFSSLLLYCVILPFRSPKSAEAYQSIWLPEGSPLIVNSYKFMNALQEELGADYKVSAGMRYCSPSLEDAINELMDESVDSITVFPCFPHYSSSTTGSVAQEVSRLLTKNDLVLPFSIIGSFYDNEYFIKYWQEQILNNLKENTDYVLFSYHGLPVRHIERLGIKECCNSPDPCSKLCSENKFCYRAQCYETTRLIANGINLKDYGTSFQSRLGREKWAMPYTESYLVELYNKGVRNLIILSPAFLADCLETIEELGIRGKEIWEELGGTSFTLLSCPNDHPTWIKGAAEIIKTNNKC